MNDDDSIFPAWFVQGAVFFFIIFIVVMVFFFVRYQREKYQLSTAVNPPILSFGSTPVELHPAQSFDLLIQLDPHNNDIHAFDVTIHYDGSKVELQNTPDTISSSVQLLRSEDAHLTSVDEARQTIRIVGVNTKSSFDSLVVIARVKARIKDDAVPGFYPLFTWDRSEVKLGDYIKIKEIEKKQKMFTVR